MLILNNITMPIPNMNLIYSWKRAHMVPWKTEQQFISARSWRGSMHEQRQSRT